jgi:hypothetical protein
MRVENRTGVMKSKEDKTPNVILICEDEQESKIVDLILKEGARVSGEIHQTDGLGEFYIRLQPEQTPNPTEFTKKVREFIIRKTAVEGVGNTQKFFAEYGSYMTQSLELIDNLTGTIQEVIELMDEEPAKEILRKAVNKWD